MRGEPAPGGLGDEVDHGLDEWKAVDEAFPLLAVELLARLGRTRSHIERTLAPVYAAHDLTASEFYVLTSLARQRPDPVLSQSDLARSLGLTAGTVSVRVAQMVDRSLVSVSSGVGRSRYVTATPDAVRRCDACRADLEFHQERLFSSLSPHQRIELAGLLRRLGLDYEIEQRNEPRSYPPLGITVEPAHLARLRRRSMGLSDVIGILVAEASSDSPIDVGDVIVEADGRSVRSILDLADHEPISEVIVVRADRRRSLRLR